MSRPNKTPHVVRDDGGRIRLKIKAGRPWGFGSGAVAHFFDEAGMRVTRQGEPVGQRSAAGFAATVWDLPDPPAPPAAGEPNLSVALGVAMRSPGFVAALADTQRAGWSIVLSRTKGDAGCRKGPNVIAIDGVWRNAVLANLVYGVALARSLAPALPAQDPRQPDFARQNAVFLLTRDAEARFEAARVRDEILAMGGADIGGPGLRGSQITAYLRFVEGAMSREAAIDAIAASVDGVEGRTFRSGRGTSTAAELEKAFGRAPSAELTAPLPAEAIAVVERVQSLRALRPENVSDALGVDLVECKKNPHFVTLVGQVERRTFGAVELRHPAGNGGGAAAPAARLLLTLGDEADLGMGAFRDWFGSGIPHHLDTWGEPHATVSYLTDTHTLYVTYSVGDDTVRGLTFEGRGPGGGVAAGGAAGRRL